MAGLRLAGVSVGAGVFVSLTSSKVVARRCLMLCDTPRLLLVVGGFYGWFMLGWCVCRGWCVRVSHVFGVGSPKVRDVMRHTSPLTGGWWLVVVYGRFTVGWCVCGGRRGRVSQNICQIECQVECQKECYECQIDCQNI